MNKTLLEDLLYTDIATTDVLTVDGLSSRIHEDGGVVHEISEDRALCPQCLVVYLAQNG